MLFCIRSSKTLAQVAQALEAATEEYKFGIIAIHDLKAKMKEKGVDYDRDCLVYEVCNAQQTKKVLEANPEISTALPCRIAVFTEGSGVTLATLLPTALLDMFRTPGLRPVAEEVEKAISGIMSQAAR